ncbi:hypothetical protein MRX96_024370 [Rhipicephalus microplus]
MAAHAGPPGFDEEADNWEAYRLRLEAYFEASVTTRVGEQGRLLVARRDVPILRQKWSYSGKMQVPFC